ncbi:RNA-binding protein [Mesorhizobium sp. M8A.F.Ca.ET.207.01.1.1]|uniref:RNA-binding protein n=1 Tax=Mesorhizobium sp. M8A.F.Ca.ET.207.01.1.1 TaxID=2563968 RepID=UPI00167AAB49|nr:RNA-binding protein [Mesorhizobium sp. M8A.F.Ca.ET.207.01.1.1]
MAFSKFTSMFTSEDLDLLQKVFDQLCRERRLALKDKDQRDQLAREVMEAFEDGFTDETELWQSLSKRRTAQA